jgi:endo-1,4-beta-D-glucanase Y
MKKTLKKQDKIKKPSTFFWKKESGAKKTDIAQDARPHASPVNTRSALAPMKESGAKKTNISRPRAGRKKILKRSALL